VGVLLIQAGHLHLTLGHERIWCMTWWVSLSCARLWLLLITLVEGNGEARRDAVTCRLDSNEEVLITKPAACCSVSLRISLRRLRG
jgi:hypothetical protein